MDWLHGENQEQAKGSDPIPPSSLGKSRLRRTVLLALGALTLVTLAGGVLGLFQITDVNRRLDAIGEIAVPLAKVSARIQGDGELLVRELQKRLGAEARLDAHRRARGIPPWLRDLLRGSVDSARFLTDSQGPWAPESVKAEWHGWIRKLSQALDRLEGASEALARALESQDAKRAAELSAEWALALDSWSNELQWGAQHADRLLRQSSHAAQSSASEVRSGLEAILGVIVALSLLLFWVSDRALRPLQGLTRLARQVAERGGIFSREDKAQMPELPLGRNDEVASLSREFRRMAATLIERDRIVEEQKTRLLQSNRQLKEVSDLNRDILRGIDSVLLVTDLSGVITQCNPAGVQWLGAGELSDVIGTRLLVWERLQGIPQIGGGLERVRRGESTRVEFRESERGGSYSGRFYPLRFGDSGAPSGAILVLDDRTEERRLSDRLQHAESLATVGRLSAQVAHEVRNPLHSIGLEAELALELLVRPSGEATLRAKQAVHAILAGVERVEKITENYLRLSRVSANPASLKVVCDLGEILEITLATYAAHCEAARVRVDWVRKNGSEALPIRGDAAQLEQVLGNLLKNSIQSLTENDQVDPLVRFELEIDAVGREVVLRVSDNGPGIPLEARERLFTPFMTTRPQGTGLGLAFVKKCVEDHSGTIRLLDAPGAVFELRFALADAHSVSRIPRIDQKELAHGLS